MKGIAHFASGVAATSFFPWAVRASLEGNPAYFVLGGACALLPDTLDFKFYRFFYHHDLYVDPDPKRFDLQAIADTLAAALRRARDERRTVTVKLNTVRLGADAWQQYAVRFDPDRQEVQVEQGPVVTTGQVPVPGTTPAAPTVARAALDAPIVQTYDAVTRVDIFDGPTFAFEPTADGRVVLHFLPWHRKWTHSFTLAGAVAVLGALLGGWRAAAVMLAGFAVHILEDQLGFMGSNLLAPFTRRRLPGLHWMRSGDAFPNFTAVWLSCLLLFWNFYRAAPAPRFTFGFLQLFLYAFALPLGAMALALYALTRGRPPEVEEVDVDDEWGDARTM